MNTCGTCRFWGTGDNERVSTTGYMDDEEFHACSAIIHDDDYYAGGKGLDILSDTDNHFGDLEEIKAEVRAIRKHLAVVQDGSGYHAAVRSRADFGCVLWQGKVTP